MRLSGPVDTDPEDNPPSSTATRPIAPASPISPPNAWPTRSRPSIARV